MCADCGRRQASMAAVLRLLLRVALAERAAMGPLGAADEGAADDARLEQLSPLQQEQLAQFNVRRPVAGPALIFHRRRGMCFLFCAACALSARNPVRLHLRVCAAAAAAAAGAARHRSCSSWCSRGTSRSGTTSDCPGPVTSAVRSFRPRRGAFPRERCLYS